jgi:hypothetical protein
MFTYLTARQGKECQLTLSYSPLVAGDGKQNYPFFSNPERGDRSKFSRHFTPMPDPVTGHTPLGCRVAVSCLFLSLARSPGCVTADHSPCGPQATVREHEGPDGRLGTPAETMIATKVTLTQCSEKKASIKR